MRKLQGNFSERYLPLRDLYLNFIHTDSVPKYSRELDLSSGISHTTYTSAHTLFMRNVFVSYPDQLMVIRLASIGPEKMSFSIQLKSLLVYDIKLLENKVVMAGMCPSPHNN